MTVLFCARLVEQFLQLSEEEAALIELRLKLANGLKTRRIVEGLTQVQLAKAVQSSQSRTERRLMDVLPRSGATYRS